MRIYSLLPILPLIALAATPVPQNPGGLSSAFTKAVRKINEEHARKPGKTKEPELGKKLPAEAKGALEKLLQLKSSPETSEALLECGEAALDLDLFESFEKIRERLERNSPEHAKKLGTALSRPAFLLRGIGGLDREYLEKFAEVFGAILTGYDEAFGFEEWSKVPGKKLRVRIHLEEKITEPPHFAPQFPFHSEIDFPVVDAKEFRSPTQDGKFLFYGLCHELGHVIAMWGDRNNEEDQHNWAHYTGVTVVEHLSKSANPPAWLKNLKDVRWRSLQIERDRLKNQKPGTKDKDSILSLFLALHDKVGTKAIGDAINQLDLKDRRLRVNGVRYYTLKELKQALIEGLKDPKARQEVENLFSL